MNWTNLFAPHILERGYHYCLNSAVKRLIKSEDKITAYVSGSSDYYVQIQVKNQAVFDMKCSCPYADDERNCKHMAAVLFEVFPDEINDLYNLDDSQYMDNLDHFQINNFTARELVDNASENLVRTFLTNILENQPRLLLQFKNATTPKSCTFNRFEYTIQINQIISEHMGRDRFISYHRAHAFIDSLQSFLDDNVQVFFIKKDYLSAFELSTLVFQAIGDVEMDDSDGGTGVIAQNCFDIWVDITDNADLPMKRTLFNWFITHLNGSIIDYLEIYIENALMTLFMEVEFVEALLQLTENKRIEAEIIDESWSKNYKISKWADYHLTLLMYIYELETDLSNAEKIDKEIEKYARKYWHFSAVRKTYINFNYESKHFEKVINLLNESIQLDASRPGLVTDYRIQLKEIYKKLNDQENYISQLWALAISEASRDLSIYNELKSQYTTSEWLDQREVLFKKMQHKSILPQLYHEEMLYDRLLKIVIDSKGIGLLQHYSDVLCKLYPSEILNKYKAEVNEMAIPTTDRKRYRQLVSILKKMKKIKGGKEVVDEITTNWRFAYSNRSAMMDEIRNL